MVIKADVQMGLNALVQGVSALAKTATPVIKNNSKSLSEQAGKLLKQASESKTAQQFLSSAQDGLGSLASKAIEGAKSLKDNQEVKKVRDGLTEVIPEAGEALRKKLATEFSKLGEGLGQHTQQIKRDAPEYKAIAKKAWADLKGTYQFAYEAYKTQKGAKKPSIVTHLQTTKTLSHATMGVARKEAQSFLRSIHPSAMLSVLPGILCCFNILREPASEKSGGTKFQRMSSVLEDTKDKLRENSRQDESNQTSAHRLGEKSKRLLNDIDRRVKQKLDKVVPP